MRFALHEFDSHEWYFGGINMAIDLRKVKGEMRFKKEYQKYLNGEYKSLEEVADFFGLPVSTISSLVKQLDLPKRGFNKKIDMDKFIEVYNKYASRQITQMEACAELGVSWPVWRKWMLRLGEERFSLKNLEFLYDMEKDYEWLQLNYLRQSKGTTDTTKNTEQTKE